MRPLEGIRVLALEHAVAAPICSRHLADLGADVIKVERPGEGDFARAYDSFVHGQASFFVWLNRGKRSVTLDLKHADAAKVLERLLDGADVLLQNLAPGAAGRLGLGHADLAPRYPKLVVCDISGYGESGPFAQKKAYDLLIQAESGLISVTGHRGACRLASASRRRISRPECMRCRASWPRWCDEVGPAKVPTSRSPCWTRWRNG